MLKCDSLRYSKPGGNVRVICESESNEIKLWMNGRPFQWNAGEKITFTPEEFKEFIEQMTEVVNAVFPGTMKE
jgi:hypothetical protein